MANSLKPGTILRSAEHEYVIEEVLGQGGFGITYRATAKIKVGKVTGKFPFAIKEHFLSATCDRDDTGCVTCSNASRTMVDGSMKDFIAEARRLSALGEKIEDIVKVNEVFEANGTAYYVMEYLEGESLKHFMERIHPTEDEIMALLMPVIRAVGKMHAMKTTHLDIKPDNIMITHDDDGNPKATLIDFGLSKHYNADGSPTSTINMLGTSDGYAPIEQYSGITTFSPTADIYALGATLLFCFSGKTPTTSTRMPPGECERVALAASPRYGAVIAKAMAPNMYDRYQSVDDLIDALGGEVVEDVDVDVEVESNAVATPHEPEVPVAGGKPTKAVNKKEEPKVVGEKKPKKENTKWWFLIAGAGAALLIFLGSLVYFINDGSKKEEEAPAGEESQHNVSVLNIGNDVKWHPEANTFTKGDYTYKMVQVPGGNGITYYGDVPSEGPDAGPKHFKYTLSSYKIGESEVPQWLWEAVMGSNPSNWKGDNLPVENVSWDDCQYFISKLNKMTGADFRLPTEAEWEFAAGELWTDVLPIYSGSYNINEVAWYKENSGRRLHEVKTKQPNSSGLYDMSGNVAEWCQDWYGDYPSSPQTNPTGPSSGIERVIRGGGYNSDEWECGIYYRNQGMPYGLGESLGLRLAL